VRATSPRQAFDEDVRGAFHDDVGGARADGQIAEAQRGEAPGEDLDGSEGDGRSADVGYEQFGRFGATVHVAHASRIHAHGYVLLNGLAAAGRVQVNRTSVNVRF